MQTVTYSNFNENSKQYLDDILEKNHEIIILKNKVPVFKISNLQSKKTDNILKNSIIFEKDIISPIDDKWELE